MSKNNRPNPSFELQPKPAKRRTETWVVVDRGEPLYYRLGTISWWRPWRCYIFHADDNTIYDASCLHQIASFCHSATVARKQTSALKKNPDLPLCMSYCKREVRHDGECVRMEGR